MAKHFFLAGTDTDVGKTLVTCALLLKWNAAGLQTVGLKPIAAGCEQTDDGWQNDDALALMEAASKKLAYQQVNPVALPEAIAPHIAAARANANVSISRLEGYIRGSMMLGQDVTIIEGAGGWLVPINGRETLADLPRQLKTPVILVIAVKLGCINHTLLTVQNIRAKGLTVAGWVANRVDSAQPAVAENVQTLVDIIDAPCLGEIPEQAGMTAEKAMSYLNDEAVTLVTG